MVTVSQALVLGIVQGLTEFLPISSSGHLILAPALLGWEVQSLAFDAALHLGTLLALLIYFSKKLWLLRDNLQLIKVVLVGTVPALLAGFFLDNYLDNLFRSPLIVVGNLIFFSLIMWVAERHSKKNREGWELVPRDGVVLGLFQALALFPGVSRSGATITGGLLRDLKTSDAAEFSFLLGIPIILGAGGMKLVSLLSDTSQFGGEWTALGVGVLASALVGLLSIKFLLRFLQNHTLKVFIVYRLLLGFAVLLFLVLR